jgi:cytoskeletal protein CcmA (bactofilin family)
MSRISRIFLPALLLSLVFLSIALPARAFETRAGDHIVIASGEVIEDDLYLAAQTVTIEGTIKGDLAVAAQTVIINGTVEGDLMAAARDIIINGNVQDDARLAGAAFLIGGDAVIGDDLIGAGASLETKPGSKIGGDLVMANAQNLLAGEVARNAHLATGAIELRGSIGGNATFALGRIENEGQRMGPMTLDPEQEITIPNLRVGLVFGPQAKIGGNLEYISDRKLDVPESAVGGTITRTEPVYGEEELREIRRANRTPAEVAMDAGFDVVRNIASLILVGLFLAWLFPNFINRLGQNIRSKPLPSLGWGLLSAAAFPFSLLVIVFIMTLGGIIFGVLTLGGLSGALIISGLTGILVLSVGFGLVVAFVTKIAVSLLAGQLILERVNPALGAHKFWPLALGVTLYAILAVIPVANVLLEIAIFLFGLGALWLLGAEWLKNRRATAEA